ncbi:MAG TPA: cytochrome P450 [Pyrinomonadaceae bacterium]|nr:cytochrome P450 [Pyrinomonadaceae bacterium]
MKSPDTSANVPGPKGNPFFGRAVKSSRRAPLDFMLNLARDYGDVCTFRVGFERVFFVNHPDYVREVFNHHYESFLKGGGNNGRAKRFLGEGVLLSEGETHRRARRLHQQAFHRQRLAAYASEMAASTERCSARWRDGEVLDVWAEMLRLTLGIVGKTLFSADVESEADEVGRAMRAAVSRYRAFKLPFAKLLERTPLPRMRRFRQGKEQLQKVVLELIAERTRSGADAGDLLSMLLLAEDDGAGAQRMTPRQVWDEALTIFIAGYDTMATALMWTWYLLSQHAEAEARLHAELDEVLNDSRPAEFADLKRLPYTERVLAEAMRIYPPTWRLVRRAVTDFNVGDYVIPKGSLVTVCQYAMHRDPRYFPDPERFDPERFTPEAKAARPPFSYFPFGGGPRRCIGEGFAQMEGVLLLATLARRWRLRLAPGHPVELFPEHLLRSKHGMLMKAEKR